MNGSIDAWRGRGSGASGRAANGKHKHSEPKVMLRLMLPGGTVGERGARGGGGGGVAGRKGRALSTGLMVAFLACPPNLLPAGGVHKHGR